MRELIVTAFVSLDGVMEAPGGEAGYAHAGWVGGFFSPELGADKEAEQLAADVLVLGRRTYESFAGAWPGRAGAMAEKINAMRKLVVSSTLPGSDWAGTSVIASDPAAAIRSVKAEDGGPILVAGSRSIVHAPLAAGLVDRIDLQVFPLVLGSGRRFFPETEEPIRLTLEDSRRLVPTGVLLQSLRVER